MCWPDRVTSPIPQYLVWEPLESLRSLTKCAPRARPTISPRYQSYSFIASNSPADSFYRLLSYKTHLSLNCDLTLVLFPEHCESLILPSIGRASLHDHLPLLSGINLLNPFDKRISESLLFSYALVSSEIRSKKTSLKSWTRPPRFGAHYHPTRSTLTRRLTWRPKL